MDRPRPHRTDQLRSGRPRPVLLKNLVAWVAFPCSLYLLGDKIHWVTKKTCHRVIRLQTQTAGSICTRSTTDRPDGLRRDRQIAEH
jgi:hypothetical protein